jgi:hypothetical protein
VAARRAGRGASVGWLIAGMSRPLHSGLPFPLVIASSLHPGRKPRRLERS